MNAYLLQFPGCWGNDGLLPVKPFWCVRCLGMWGHAFDLRLLLARRFQLAEQHDVGASSSLPTSLASLLGPDLTRAVGSYVQLPCLIWFQDTLFGGLETDVQPSSPTSLSCSRTPRCVLRRTADCGAGDYRGARHSGRTQQLFRNGRLSPRLGLLHHVRAPCNVHQLEHGVHTARHQLYNTQDVTCCRHVSVFQVRAQ